MRYIGSKVKLLDKIKEVIEQNTKNATSLCDIFSGTTAVARHFKKDYKIISNDFLYFSYVIQMATIKNTKIPTFDKLNKFLGCDVFSFLDGISDNKGIEFDESKFLIRNTYSEYCGRNYLTQENATTIDKWRICIENWKDSNLIDEGEYFYLVTDCVSVVEK